MASATRLSGLRETLFGRLTVTNAASVLKGVGGLWLVVSCVNAFSAAIFLSVNGYSNIGVLSYLPDVLIGVFAWYFIPKRKSRAVAVCVGVFGLYTVFTWISQGSRNYIVMLFIVWAVWRGVQATFYWHKATGSKINWRRVGIGSGLLIGACFFVFVIGVVVARIRGVLDVEMGFILSNVTLISGVVVLAVYSAKWPFAEKSMYVGGE
jgi:hypothetical protein